MYKVSVYRFHYCAHFLFSWKAEEEESENGNLVHLFTCGAATQVNKWCISSSSSSSPPPAKFKEV